MTEPRRIELATLADGGLAGRFGAMASPCEVLVDGADAVELAALTERAAAEVWRVESLWSRYQSGNIVDRINRAQGQPIEVDPETARFLDYAQELYTLSDGLFDVTSGVLRRVWQFDGSDRVPTAQAVADVLPLVGWHRVDWRSPRLQMPAGMQIDFGGIGKEYAVDRALTVLTAHCARPLLVNCGGDLAASAPRSDDRAWLVGIDAAIPEVATPLIRLRRGGVATSGDAHRFLLKDGRRFPHILNPKTGWPVMDAPRVVTVAADSCTEAGALSTLAMLQGAQAQAFLDGLGADAQVIW